MVRAVGVAGVQGFPRQELADAAGSLGGCWRDGRDVCAICPTASVVASIRTVLLGMRLRLLWRRRGTCLGWRRRLFFDGRYRRRRNVGAVCEGEVDGRQLGQLETPIWLAVGRHVLLVLAVAVLWTGES